MRTLSIAVALAATATACSYQAGDTATISGNTLALAALSAAPEPNAAGDIPDTQVFVTFAGPGYSVLVPEGWSRTQRGSAVTFRSNANSELIEVRRGEAPYDLRARFHPVGTIRLSKHALLGTEAATRITFRSRSEADPVTGKSVELDNELYTTASAHRGGYATLVLSAPVGADNADQWKKIVQSFRWK